ncbi:MAG: metal-dependent hydrolase, partial [Bacteroidota bacterium]
GIGTVVAGLSLVRPAQKVKIVLAGALGGVWADIDGLSLWAGFDRFIGTPLGLSESGFEIYFGTHWYSHQSFFHSILGLLVVTGLFWYLSSLLYAHGLKRARRWTQAAEYLAPYFYAFAGGYALHLIGDLFTPAGNWGGIRLLYPLDQYVGGWGMVWWWNNYDIFLLLCLALVFNVFSLVAFSMLSKAGKWLPSVIYACCFLLVGFQFHYRNYDFNHQGYLPREAASHDFQKQVLSEPIYDAMVNLDRKLPVYF